MCLAASQDSEPLWRAEEIGSDVNQTDILDAGMKYVNIRKIRTTQWATIFPMTDAGYGIILEYKATNPKGSESEGSLIPFLIPRCNQPSRSFRHWTLME